VSLPQRRTDCPGQRGPGVIPSSARKVYKTGDVEVQALRDVSLTIERRELCAIMGAAARAVDLMNIIGRSTAQLRPLPLDGVDVSMQTRSHSPGCATQDRLRLPVLQPAAAAHALHKRGAPHLWRVPRPNAAAGQGGPCARGLSDPDRSHPNQLSGVSSSASPSPAPSSPRVLLLRRRAHRALDSEMTGQIMSCSVPFMKAG